MNFSLFKSNMLFGLTLEMDYWEWIGLETVGVWHIHHSTVTPPTAETGSKLKIKCA